MADRPNYTPFSIVARLAAGLLTLSLLGAPFLDLIAAQRADWHARARQVGFEATQKYLRVLATFEGVK